MPARFTPAADNFMSTLEHCSFQELVDIATNTPSPVLYSLIFTLYKNDHTLLSYRLTDAWMSYADDVEASLNDSTGEATITTPCGVINFAGTGPDSFADYLLPKERTPAGNTTPDTPYCIWVVSFAPCHTEGGVGGHVWSVDKDVAIQSYRTHVRESSQSAGSHIVRLHRVDMPFNPQEGDNGEVINTFLDENLDLLECFAPALRQYVPFHTPSILLPIGGVVDREQAAVILG